MQRKQPGQDRASPNRSGQPFENQEDKQRIDRVPQYARQVMAPRLQAVEPAIQHVRNPGQRMPVRLFAMDFAKGPSQRLPGQTCLHLQILSHIHIVVVVDKVVVQRGEKTPKHEHKQQDTNSNCLSPAKEHQGQLHTGKLPRTASCRTSVCLGPGIGPRTFSVGIFTQHI